MQMYKYYCNASGLFQIMTLCCLLFYLGGSVPLKVKHQLCLAFLLSVYGMTRHLMGFADRRWHLSLLPNTRRSHDSIFQLFLALMINLTIHCPCSESGVLVYLRVSGLPRLSCNDPHLCAASLLCCFPEAIGHFYLKEEDFVCQIS